MRSFRVYFNDGNQKLFNAPHIGAVVRYISESLRDSYGIGDIIKIEEITNEEEHHNR